MKLGNLPRLINKNYQRLFLTTVFLATIYSSIFSLAGQPSLSLPDSARADRFLQQADSLLDFSASQEAIPLFEKAARLYHQAGLEEQAILAFNSYLGLLIDLRSPKAPPLADSLQAMLPQLRRWYQPGHAPLLHSLHNLGYYENTQLNFEKSWQYFEELFRWGDSLGFPSEKLFILSAVNYSNTLCNFNEFEQALGLLHKAESMLNESTEKMKKAIYTAFAITYLNRNQNIYAKVYLEKALEEKKKIARKDGKGLGKIYLNLAAVTKELFELKKSKEYGEEALRQIVQGYGEQHLYTAYVYNNLGNTLRLLREYDRSEACQMKSMEIRRQLYGENHLLMADPYQNLGNLYLDMGRYEEAIVNAKKAADLWISHYGKTHANVIRIYNQLSLCYERLEQYPEALLYAEKAIEFAAERAENPIEFYASILGQKGKILRLMGRYEASLLFLQQAIIQIHDDFTETDWRINPPLLTNQNERFLRGFLEDKGLCLQALFHQNQELPLLKLAAGCFQIASQAVDSLRTRNEEEEDLLYTSRRSRDMFQAAIEVQVELYQLTHENVYLERAFLYAEKSKNATLEAALQDANARKMSGLPENLRELELEIRSDMNFQEEQVKLWREKQDSLNINKSLALFFQFKTKHDSLIKHFRESFPAYYALRYSPFSIGLTETQLALDARTSFVSFAAGDSSLFAFVATRDNAEVFQLSWTKEQQASLQTFLSDLRDPSEALAKENDPAAIATFEEQAYQLYQQLLAPLKLDTQNPIWIAPDGLLGYLPFEILLTQKKGTPATSFRELAYLFRRQSLRYAFSATIALGEKGDRTPAKSLCYIGFAPSYAGGVEVMASIRGMDEEMITRNSFSNLYANQPEIEQVSNLWHGTAILGTAATEGAFKARAGGYDILHLAMHAFTNDQQPAYSGLIFAPEADSSEDQVLYAYEIANMDLPVELAVLSACNTGAGVVAREGVMSLARAFRYAGCRNLLTSLWQVEDRSAARLVYDFFLQLQQHLPKDEALRQARLTYLEQGRHPHPYFWASFVLIGDDLPLKKEADFPLMEVLLISLLAGLIGLFFLKMKKKQKNC